uniref:Kinesin motor domain-containing protein n=1 Tax=Salix viminalis TaxID=40686 RepID=A0A6N2L2B5_SALVM
MPQETNNGSIFTSPCKNLRGLKGLMSSNEASYTEEIINDRELAQRKAEEAASRRYQAAEWLRQMDKGGSRSLPKEPSEEEFCLALRNGLILCNVLNKVNPGAVLKVVDNTILTVQSTEGAAQSAIQYFENMRNFLMAVKDMKLLTFEASDLEKGGSSSKVVDCILCLKGYYEWKQAGGIGVWRYGGLVKIVSFPKELPSSLVGSESADESVDESESSQYEQLLEFLHLSNEVAIEETQTANALAFLFDHFGLRLLQAYLKESNGIEELPLNGMVVDALLSKVVKDFSALLVSQGTQLGLFLKKILKGDIGCLSKTEFIEAISQYLTQRTSVGSSDFSKFCICGGKKETIRHIVSNSSGHAEVIDLHQKQLEELRFHYKDTRQQVKQIQAGWEEEVEHHIRDLEVASSTYHQVLEENRQLYNQVQDLKGTIRVYCRVRPFLPGQSSRESAVDYIGENGNIMIVNPLKNGKEARKVFSFNKVFGSNVTQEQIYVDTQPLVRSVLDGYNVCIFAYGQTGSGKTYTMSGPDLTSEETWGVNYRALRDLFQISKTRGDVIKYEVGVQMIEIYNEQLNGLNVPDASWIPVSSTQDVLDLMKIGHRNRAVGATALNERSSRSHSILTVHVYGKELVSGSILKGCLHLVDLAGSERVDKSEAVGERLKEAQHINRSLSALGDVISALAQKSPHVPYRNSKLTQVLQDSLGGHAKTLMFVHINPELNSIGETISTLKFAERVASIELGAAKSNKETGEIRELKEEISNLKHTLERKEAEIEQIKGGSTRSTAESQRTRAVSPFSVPRYGTNASFKPETSQRSNDDAKSLEIRSCSSGKQRRSRFPSSLTDKEALPRIPFLGEEMLASSTKPRSPSPPVRRSISTDRGAHIRSRVKETVENQPVARVPFPARVPINKSIAAIPVIPSADNSSKGPYKGSQEAVKQDNISNAFYNFQRVSTRKVYPEHDEEQFRQALNIRQGGIRKGKNESKVKAKYQLPAKFNKSDVGTTMLSHIYAGEKIEEPRKSDFSEPENEHLLPVSPTIGVLKVKKLQRNLSRNSQNLEPRVVQAVEPLISGKLENKLPNNVTHTVKEGGNTSMPEFRRSRSTPRGKLVVFQFKCIETIINCCRGTAFGAEPTNNPKLSSTEKETEEQTTNKSPQISVTYIYTVELAELCSNVTVTWSKNVMNCSLSISVENPLDENHYTCKIDIKTWQFWGKKGLKSFEVDGKRVDVYWDFRQAKFSNHAEPLSDYYVALVYNEEVVLLLGDMKMDALKRTKRRPSLTEPILLCKKENVYGKRSFCAKAMFQKDKTEHDLVIEYSLSGLGDPEMGIAVDGFEVIRVMNLNWRFRGNENVKVNDVEVQIFWDVHDWLFSGSSTSHGLFILKPAAQEGGDDKVGDGRHCRGNDGGMYDSPKERSSSTPEFFHVINAWKYE